MTMLKNLLFGLALLSMGCGTSALDEIESAKDKLCACKEKKCVRSVKKESMKLKDKVKELTNEDKLKAMKFAEQAAACAKKIR